MIFPTEQARHDFEFARSRDFFADPSSYRQFDLVCGNTLLNCIEPRDQVGKVPKTVMQTPGGAYGESHDAALTHAALTGEIIPLSAALCEDASVRRTTLLGAHRNGCKFLTNIVAILNEEAEPSDFTQGAIERWSTTYDLREVVDDNLPRITVAAARLRDFLREKGVGYIEQATETLYPHQDTVIDVSGIHPAHIYVTNHHPHLGLDREKKHRQEGLTILGYHDSLRAVVDDLSHTYGLSPEARGLRLAAIFTRSAATRTALLGLGVRECYEVTPGQHGPQVTLSHVETTRQE